MGGNGKRARGIDISKWQANFIDPGNIDFIIVKATEGWDVDPAFQDYLPHICSIPIRGAYHYFRTETNPIRQAENFLLQSLKGDFHFLAVDYESRGNVLDRTGAENLLKCMLWLRNNSKLPVVLYTTPYAYRDNVRVWSEEFDTFPLWIARWKYQDCDVADPTGNLAGDDLERSWSIWQHTSTGDGALYGVGSVCVDLNVYNGTVEQMKDWLIPIEEEITMKKWYTSKTFWFSVLFALVNVAGLFGYGDFTPSPEVVQYVGIGVSVIGALVGVIVKLYEKEP